MAGTAIGIVATGLTMVFGLVVTYLASDALDAPSWLGLILCSGVTVASTLGAARYLLGNRKTTKVAVARACVVGAINWLALATALAARRIWLVEAVDQVPKDPPGSAAFGALAIWINNVALIGSIVFAVLCGGLALLYRLNQRSPSDDLVGRP